MKMSNLAQYQLKADERMSNSFPVFLFVIIIIDDLFQKGMQIT